MRLAYQLISHLERTILLGTISKCDFIQIRYRHKPPKKLETVQTKKSECIQPRPPKKSIWNIFKRKSVPKCVEREKKEKRKVKECETVPRLVPEDQAESDLYQITRMGGTAYRTCGPAYLLQKDYIEQAEIKMEPEEKILDEMMKDPTLKDQCDPMPPFESVERRLIDLSERKLHPLYKRLMSIPRRPKPEPSGSVISYQSRSGPIMPEDVPEHLKICKEMFEKKNILHEFKKAQPPQQMMARLVEMKKNERTTMQKKIIEKGNAKKDCTK